VLCGLQACFLWLLLVGGCTLGRVVRRLLVGLVLLCCDFGATDKLLDPCAGDCGSAGRGLGVPGCPDFRLVRALLALGRYCPPAARQLRPVARVLFFSPASLLALAFLPLPWLRRCDASAIVPVRFFYLLSRGTVRSGSPCPPLFAVGLNGPAICARGLCVRSRRQLISCASPLMLVDCQGVTLFPGLV